MSRVSVSITPSTVLLGIGLVAAGFVVWRGQQALKDAMGWVTGIPERVREYAREGGQTFLDEQIPNVINRKTTEGSYTPVYADPLKNDDGVDFRYF